MAQEITITVDVAGLSQDEIYQMYTEASELSLYPDSSPALVAAWCVLTADLAIRFAELVRFGKKGGGDE